MAEEEVGKGEGTRRWRVRRWGRVGGMAKDRERGDGGLGWKEVRTGMDRWTLGGRKEGELMSFRSGFLSVFHPRNFGKTFRSTA